MGIQKALDTAYGVPATHWLITKINIDLASQSVYVQLEGRNVKSAAIPLVVREYNISTSLLPKCNGLMKDIYAYLLTTIAVPATINPDGTVIPATPFSEFYQAPEET